MNTEKNKNIPEKGQNTKEQHTEVHQAGTPGADSAIPGINKKGEIANPAAEAGLGDNQGRGTSSYKS